MFYLQCMGTNIRLTDACSVPMLRQQCTSANAPYSALVSQFRTSIKVDDVLYVGFDDGGPSIAVPRDSVDFVFELLARIHNSSSGHVYEQTLYADVDRISDAVGGGGDDEPSSL